MLLVSVIHLHFNCTADFLYSFLKCTLFVSRMFVVVGNSTSFLRWQEREEQS